MRGRISASTTAVNASCKVGNTSKEMPPQFAESLHVLFDILDTSRTGFVHFEHIASKWRQLPTRGLPPNFLDCLRRVTPANGALDFSRFLAGVRLSLNERNAACAPCQRVYAANYQGRLQRVRSEGKLHDIRNIKEMTGRTPTTALKTGPTMDVNMLFPTASTKSFVCNAAQIQRRKEYRSQPDISGKDSAFFDKFSSHSKENCGDSGKYGIVMRPKKSKNLRAPPPPHADGRNSCADCFTSPSSTTSSSTANDTPMKMARKNRPNSINSAVSSSSGFSELQSAISCPTKSATPYADELRPQVAKHERLLAEEWTVVRKGAETTRRLQRWFQERVDSLEKRKSMLERGMVALDSAVHEQKLNFYRAQISELTRRMNALMGSSEHGFPTHRNMNAPENGGEPDAAVRQLRNSASSGVSPAKFGAFCGSAPRLMAAKTGDSLGSSSTSSSTRTSASMASTASRISSSSISSPEPKIFDANIDKLVQQQQKLFEIKLDAKSRLIEKLQREKRVHEQREVEYSGHDKPFVDTIRKPMVTGISAIGERRNYLDVGQKLVNDTLL